MPRPPRTPAGRALAAAALAVTAVAVPASTPARAADVGARAAAIGADVAWAHSTGRGTVVAVLDSGVQLDHPALRGHLWRNPDEIADNGRDDDGNGVVDDVTGANMLAPRSAPDDDHGHGTHVAGIVAGIAPDAAIMPVKVLDARNAGTWDVLVAGLRYAVAEGADVVNVSVNGDASTPGLEQAVAAAGAAGVTVVASAGNDGRDIDARPSYPVSLTATAILGVTALDEDGSPWAQGNRGPRSVDLAAPGRFVRSTARGSGFEDRSGTSMAAPHVAGALALLAAARPDLGQPELRSALLAAADRDGMAGLVGAGRLDVGAAMRALIPAGATAVAATGRAVRLRAAGPRRVRAGRVTVRWRVTGRAEVARWRVTLDGRVVARPAGRGAREARFRVAPGGHRWRVVALDAAGRPLAAAGARLRAVRARG